MALWDMRTADVIVDAVGWDFTRLSLLLYHVWRLKTALAPGITQVSLRNTEDGPVETYIGCAINPL